MKKPIRRSAAAWALLAGVVVAGNATEVVVTLGGGVVGTTPAVLGYNLGHFMPGSNAADWWRYTGARAARVFLSPSLIEASDDIAGRGDGVTDLAGFLARRQALRANAADPARALDNNFINWPYLLNRYANATSTGNRFRTDYAFGELRRQGVEILAQITASLGSFDITDADDWAGKWELWQHYYAQAFYLGREYGVRRYSMFNEPNHSAAGGITFAQWQERLELASDAIQAALADLNGRYGLVLEPEIFAPNTAAATGTALEEWGVPAVQLRHRRFDGTTDAGWWNFHLYNYQYYGTTPDTFASQMATVRSRVTGLMPGETPYALGLTEFNVSTAANFDASSLTLDDSVRYSRLGANLVALTEAGAAQIYVFKFGQTERTDAGSNYPVQKNGTHYVNNDTGSSVNNYGGATMAAEVYRLFNDVAAGGRPRLAWSGGAGDSPRIVVSREAGAGEIKVFAANIATSAVELVFATAGVGVPDGVTAVVREVSTRSRGEVAALPRVVDGRLEAITMPAESAVEVVLPLDAQPVAGAAADWRVAAVGDVQLADGAGQAVVNSTGMELVARSDGTVDGRRVVWMKFRLPAGDRAEWRAVLLELTAGATGNGAAQAHVYGVESDGWSEAGVSWATLSGVLKRGVAAGNTIANNVVDGQGTTTRMLGQLSVSNATLARHRIDVTDFVRGQTDGYASFLVVQDHRWDETLNSAHTPGDTQARGIRIASREAGVTGPALRILATDTGEAGWEAWRNANFDAAVWSDEAVVGAAADPDGDGRSNLLEYALGSDPRVAESTGGLAIVNEDGAPRVVGTLWSAPGLTNEVQYCAGLGEAWETVWQSVGERSEWVEVALPVSSVGAKGFYRLRVTLDL